MSRPKMHAKRELSYDPQTEGPVWTLCQRHVPQSQVAAFVPEGVSCKSCAAALAWREENERDWVARRLAHGIRARRLASLRVCTR